MRLLIGEHDGRMQTVVAGALRRVGYSVDIARNGAELRGMAATVNYALLILNAEESGPALVRTLRHDDFRAPILVASASVGSLIDMLDDGADDGLLKPFNNLELLARVRALLRRCPRGAKSVVCAGNIELEEAAGEVRCLGRPIHPATAQRAPVAADLVGPQRQCRFQGNAGADTVALPWRGIDERDRSGGVARAQAARRGAIGNRHFDGTRDWLSAEHLETTACAGNGDFVRCRGAQFGLTGSSREPAMPTRSIALPQSGVPALNRQDALATTWGPFL